MTRPRLAVREGNAEIDIRAWARAVAAEVVRLDREGKLPKRESVARPARKAVP